MGIAAVNISAGYYNEHRPHEYINLAHMTHNILRIWEMIQTPTEVFEYIERAYDYGSFGGQIPLWDICPGVMSQPDDRKLLMPLPETAHVEVNGKWVNNGLAHFVDEKGVVYDYLDELDAVVRADYAKAYGEDEQPLQFSKRSAQKVKVISLEDALAKFSF